MTALFWSTYGLGLALFAAPGPINVETVRHGVNGGHRPALAVQLGAIGAELAWAAAVLGGVAPFMERPGVRPAMAALGAGFLLWAAWQALRQALAAPVAAPQPHAAQAALAGALAAVGNPLSAMFWLAMAGVVTAAGVTELRPIHIVVVGSGFVLGALSWSLPFTALAAGGRRFMQPSLWRWWNALSGVALGGYGIHLLWVNLLNG